MLILVSILLALGLLFWVVQSLLLLQTLRVLPALRGRRRSARADDPLVSVIVPARNEQVVVEAAIRSRLEDSDPQLEFILVDDRSTDSTGMILDHLAETDPRVRVVHVEELPVRWLGKVHAMQVGMRHARGTWVLLSDADVHVAPGTVREAVDLARSLEVVHLAGLPAIQSPSLRLQLCLAPLQRVLILLLRLWSVRDPGSDAAMGVGAFNLVRRDAFEEAGGCEALRMEVIDDVGVGVMIKKHGGGSCTAFASACLRISWYDRFSDFIHGIQRGMAKRPSWCPRWVLALLVLIVAGLDLSPFIALVGGIVVAPVGWIGIGFSAWAVLLSAIVARRFGTSAAIAVMVPLNTLLATMVALRVVLRGGRHGRIQWRGTTYEVADLQQGSVVRFTGDGIRNETGEGP